MSEKTEQPSAKKLRDSRKKGDVAYSKDFTQTVLIIAVFGYLLANGGGILQDMMGMILLPASLGNMAFTDAANVLVTTLLKEAAWLMLPFLGIILGLGVLADALQVGLVLAFEKLKPSAKKISVISNLKNIFSKKNLVEFLKSCLKIGFLSVLLWMLLRDAFPIMTSIPQAGALGMGEVVGELLKVMLINIGFAYTVIALADFAWQRYQHRKGLMMSKDEVKREYKEMEGDAHIKHKRKQLHQEMLQEGAVQSARKASVLVTNPTHLAVALYYQPEETALPVVTAMGEGALAERMKQAALEAGVPVMQNIPLARGLFADAQVGQFIPSELVEPVAEILRLLRQTGPDGVPLID